MRANEESSRRFSEYHRSAYVPATLPYHFGTSPLYSTVATKCLWASLNTTIALYIFDKRQNFPYVPAMDIEAWLWRQWFKPYESNIALHYFSSIFAVEYNVNLADRKFRPEKLAAFHCNTYEQAQRVKDTVVPEGEKDASTPAVHGPLRSQPWPVYQSDFDGHRRLASSTIQPLYRALFIALFCPQKNIHDLRMPEEIPEVEVQLVLTGITEGLSAPISLEELRDDALDGSYHPGATAIKTSLGAAVRFIMGLEQREIAASGGILQPDVAKLHWWDWHRVEAKKLGWIEERDGNLDDLSPRSFEWVDRNIFKKWVGAGAIRTLQFALGIHSLLNPFLEDSQENWWWWDRKLLPEQLDIAELDRRVAARLEACIISSNLTTLSLVTL
ncbi:hypothetical protein M434DRAFT_380814 [Hypoxylon sp. CO27-5]|nr:hypothetical protein M434DRAFT_380814 [Hypoxylon sp. CO27-5]